MWTIWTLLACTAGADKSADTAEPPDPDELRARLEEAGVAVPEPPPETPAALVELGVLLNADPILSGNQNISCATCHQPALGGDDDRPTPIGQGGEGVAMERTSEYPKFYLGRNTPTMFNAHLLDEMFWDGHAAELPDGTWLSPFGKDLTDELIARLDYGVVSIQALAPLVVSDEMLGDADDNEVSGYVLYQGWDDIWAGLTARVAATEAYRPYFEAAFPEIAFEEITIAEIADAIAAMEIEAYASSGSPLDAFLAGDDAALGEAALRGGLAFTDPDGANCAACHSGPLLTDLDYHNTLLAQYGIGKACADAETEPGSGRFDDLGRECTTGDEADRHHFRTAPLRNLSLSAPYGHAGQYRTLAEFVAHYADPEASLASWDPATDQDDPQLADTRLDTDAALIASADPILAEVRLDEADVPDLVAFLESLDDPTLTHLPDYLPAEVPSGLPVDAPTGLAR